MAEKSWREAVEAVLEDAGTALHYTAIAENISQNKLRTNVGANPATSVNVTISNSIKTEGDKSPFERVGLGQYILKDKSKWKQSKEYSVDETEYVTIPAFGMYWQRNSVEWKTNPQIKGFQQEDAQSVDFCDQRGIYVLYDEHRPIYVGRTTDRSLGNRLLEHTKDRLAGRWSRFSWFGLQAVETNGKLVTLPENQNIAVATLISTMEALLIEAMEPPLNRRRGDDFAASEYYQDISNQNQKATAKVLKELVKQLESG